jgi:ferritin-like metal-binding protein YciE
MSRDLLIAWLNDAYAMETALVPILENHAKDARDHPEIASRITEHRDETRRHAELIRGCVEGLGSSTSMTKTTVGTLFGSLQSVATGLFSDEPVKNGITDYATEHFEIACYNAIVAAAQQLSEIRVAEVCREIIRDEERMATWLSTQLPSIVREALIKEGSTGTARARGAGA